METPAQIAVLVEQNSYISLAILTAVVYDYMLTLPREIEYIWNQRLTSVSALFILVRYSSLLNVTANTLLGSTPAYWQASNTAYLIGLWTYAIFVSAADVVMILRVYAMYRCSKPLRRFLFVFYILGIALLIAFDGMGSNPGWLPDPSGDTVQFDSVSACVTFLEATSVTTYSALALFIFSVLLCILGIVQFVKQSIQMYRATRQWQFNRYMSLLVREGVLYFLATQTPFLVTLRLPFVFVVQTQTWEQVLFVTSRIFMYTLTPRFIINIREMYANDAHRRFEIDTGFGLRSLSTRSTGPNIRSAIAFAGRSGEERGGGEHE